MNKKTVLIVAGCVLVLVVAAGTYFYLSQKGGEPAASSGPATEADTSASSNANVAIQAAVDSANNNPMEKNPDVNPADKANPFNSVKTNPFE